MIPKEAKIYIAGHRGLVGGAILKKYQSEGYTNLVTRTRAELDLVRQDQVERFFDETRPEYVILAAARVGGIKANMTQQATFLYENLAIQNNVIWEAHNYETQKLMFLGSSCIYPRECPQPMKEEYLLTGLLEPTNEGYAIAKIAGLKLCEKIHEQFGKKFISVMPSNVYGPNDHFEPERSHVISGMITRMIEAKRQNAPTFEIWGTGTARREFLYVDDLADAVYFVMENYDERQFINVGSGEDISITELAKLLQELVGYQGEFVYNTEKPDGMPRKLMDVTRLQKLGWVAPTSFRDGLNRTINWYLENREIQSSNEK